MRAMPFAAALLTLAGCHRSQPATADGDVSIVAADQAQGGQVSVAVPGFAGRLGLPGVDLGRHLDLDGIALAPGTAVHRVNVGSQAGAATGDRVEIAFTSPHDPAALAGWYRAQASRAGYADVVAAADTVTAGKRGKRFAFAATPRGGGSAGTITITEGR